MKLTIFFGVMVAALTASAIEIPASVDCLLYKGDLKESSGKLSAPQSITFSREHLVSTGNWQQVGEFDGLTIALDVQLPREQYDEHNLKITLSESSADGKAVTTLVGTDMENQRVNFMYRQPGSNKFLVVNCFARH